MMRRLYAVAMNVDHQARRSLESIMISSEERRFSPSMLTRLSRVWPHSSPFEGVFRSQ